jgi:glycosyltransferase involved in cell wall biosynthesis
MVERPAGVLFVHYGDDWIRGSERLLLDLIDNLDRHRFAPVLWCNAAAMARAAAAAGIEVTVSPAEFYLSAGAPAVDPRRYLAQVRQGRELVRRHAIRLIHANSAAPAQWLVPVARSARVPLIAHLHTPYLRRDRLISLAHQATAIVGASTPCIADWRGDGVPAARAIVIPNGIDAARLSAAPAGALRVALGIADDAIVIGCVGSLIVRKGVDVVLEAMAGLDRAADIRLVVAGDGPERHALEQRAQGLGIAERVHFLGHCEAPSEVYRALDLLVLASRQEAFGLVLLEAALFDVPSIATSVGGIPDVVVDGQTGVLVPPGDGRALGAAVRALVADPGRRRRLGHAAGRRVREHFLVERMAADVQALYEGLLALPAGRLGWRGAWYPRAPLRQLRDAVRQSLLPR